MGVIRKLKAKRDAQRPPEPEPMPMPEQPSVAENTAQEVATVAKVNEMMGAGQTPFAEYIYNTDPLPKEMDMFPTLRNKTLALTNVKDGKDLDWLMTHVDNMKSRYKFATPKRKQNPKLLSWFNEMRFFSAIQLMRSMGGKDRDRALLTTVTTYQDKPMPRRKPSILGKLGGAVV